MRIDGTSHNDVPTVTSAQFEGTDGSDILIGTNDPDQIYGFGGDDHRSRAAAEAD